MRQANIAYEMKYKAARGRTTHSSGKFMACDHFVSDTSQKFFFVFFLTCLFMPSVFLDLLSPVSTMPARRVVVIGKGMESTVYAVNLELQHASVVCALRVPHACNKTRTEIGRLRVMRSMPPHVNVVTVMGGMQAPACEQIVLMLEYVRGCTLKQSMDSCVWSPCDALPASREIVAGLAHLHRYELRHGDVNLNNILLQGRTCKLTDYFVDSTHGAPAYMAPEVLHGNRVLANDIWSVACVFLALHGKEPFFGEDVGAVLWKLANGSSPENIPACSFADLIAQIFVPVIQRPSAEQVMKTLNVM